MNNPNMSLPSLPAWQARSFWAVILTAILTVCSAFDIDLLGRLGTTENGVLDAIDTLMPIATAIWAWLERRAPNHRLSFPGGAMGALPLAVAMEILVFGALAQNQALASARCADRAGLLAVLADQFDESPVGMGLAEGAVVELLLSEGRTWTVLVTRPDGTSCILAGGTDWDAAEIAPDGDPA